MRASLKWNRILGEEYHLGKIVRRILTHNYEIPVVELRYGMHGAIESRLYNLYLTVFYTYKIIVPLTI